MEEVVKHYSNDEITIVWKPALCIHSKLCWTNLGKVFDPRKRPWVEIGGATTQEIQQQIDKCPSGALSYYMNGQGKAAEDAETSVDTTVEVMPNGPLMVYGNITIKHADGSEEQKHKVTAFCRCGGSSNKPYCDGTHAKKGFRDWEEGGRN